MCLRKMGFLYRRDATGKVLRQEHCINSRLILSLGVMRLASPEIEKVLKGMADPFGRPIKCDRPNIHDTQSPETLF